HIGGMLIAQGLVLLQGFVDGSFEVGGNLMIQTHRRCRYFAENAVKNGCRSSALEWQSPGGHLIEHNPKREEVGAGIEFFSEHLLRRHVSHGTDRGSGTGEMFIDPCGSVGGSFGGINSPAGGVQLRQSEIENLDVPALGDKN